MEILGRILDREIKFEVYDTSKNWIADFPKGNWCLVIIAEEENRNYFDEIIRKAIDRNVGYIHSVGKQHDLIHDLADEEIVIREVENLYLPKHVIMTTGDEDFENGIWFGTYVTHNEETEITQVVILDVSRNAREKTIELIKKFESGYLPED
ncbi:hypothetical protein L1S35_05345 [Flavobacterium sp. AS60]|uniref:hypothetical protein n=1 Tax=Flavobacterium anseongense TaxID=2910677 RepID=UPI001F2A6E8E|nr:hypothetical protein [Flavobacterium sp. AS60]MCF6129090.1 hypothetical protein [Flavobacterium sp. AS60]